MAVLLRDTAPPIKDVAELGQASVAVYSLLFESAYKDRRFDFDREDKKTVRRDMGGTTSWSHKAIADTLHMSSKTVIKATNLLLDNGYLTVIDWAESSTGSKHRVYRVIHPKDVPAQQHFISLFNELPSVRWKAIEEYRQKTKVDTELGSLEEL
jgi:DNA-binding transcriptional MocR family regulator